VIFGFSMVLLWDQWQIFNGNKATFFPMATPVAKSTPSKPVASASVPVGAPSAAVPPPVSTTPAATPGALPATTPSTTKERLVVTTDVITLTFDTEGGTVVGSAFTHLKEMDDKNSGFVLLDESANRVYVAQSGLIAGSAGGFFKNPGVHYRSSGESSSVALLSLVRSMGLTVTEYGADASHVTTSATAIEA
jgi:YidC/Oxa1 family membrane protein insertase